MSCDMEKNAMNQILSEDAWLASVGKHRGVAIRILDVFEEMLDNKGISIPDDDRTGDESEACLYGMTYATLEDELSDLLGRYYSQEANFELEADQQYTAMKVTRTFTIDGSVSYEDIRSFETEGFFGIWDHNEYAFVLLPKRNFQFHRYTLDECRSLAELDDAVYRICFEHIERISKSNSYTISGR